MRMTRLIVVSFGALWLASCAATAPECFMRSDFCVAAPAQICHLQLWNPPTPDLPSTHAAHGYKRLALIERIMVSGSSGYTIVKHSADVGPLYGNPFAGDGGGNRGLSVLDVRPETTPPLDPANWWYSTARVYYGNYREPRRGGQYLIAKGAGMEYDVRFDHPIELGPNGGVIVRNVKKNEDLNATFSWCEKWVAM